MHELTQGSPSTSAAATLTCVLSAPIAVGTLQALQCTFAGGFAPVRIVSMAGFAAPDAPKDVAWVDFHEAYPADGNMAQRFAYDAAHVQMRLAAQGRAEAACTHLGVRLEGSTDGFGRVIVYGLGIYDT